MPVRRSLMSASRPLRPAGRASAWLIAAALVLALAAPGRAADLVARFEFQPSDLRVQPTADGVEVSLAGLPAAGGDVEPSLPFAVRTFYVPEGFEVGDVRVVARRETRVAEGVRLSLRDAARAERAPEMDRDDVVRSWPAGAVEADAPSLPARAGLSLGQGTLGGHRLHSVAVFPVRWEKSSGDLLVANSVDVELELVPARTRTDLVRERQSPASERAWVDAVRSLVANPGDVPAAPDVPASTPGGFAPRDLPSVDGPAVDYVIVTTAALAPEFQSFADWKTRKGRPTVVRTVEWIEQNYPAGHDRPERIRMFLRDAYSKWGTFLVLLGGDYDIVPPREAYNRFFFGGVHIPTDQYYACLEGDWNGDGDDLIGEGDFQSTPGDDADLYPDVFVGRAPVETPAQIATFVAKSMLYEKTPPAGYVEDVCYLAEVLFPDYWVYGDPPEGITLDGATLTEEFDLLVPPAWARTKNYQTTNNLDRPRALTALSFGHHLLTLMNHGDAFKFSCGNGVNPLIFLADTDTLTNGPKLSFVMATACNPNQFDLECMGESMMNNPTGGAFAVVGPTREDFPLSAANYHQGLLDLVFQRGLTDLGASMQMHRVPFVPLAQTDATPDRWTFMTKEFFGDPDLRLWTQEPEALVVTHASSVVLGTASITVTVADGGAAPVADALVCVSDANGTYSRLRTNAAGQAVLPLTSAATGTVDVVVTAPEYKPSETTFGLTAPAGAQLALSSSTVDDDGSGSSSGNGDGAVDAGETIELGLAVNNGGGVAATSATATASIEAGTGATFDLRWNGAADPARVFVGPDAVSPGAVPFTLDFASPAIEYIGAPPLTFAPDSAAASIGIYVWQDDDGWHVRWSGGADPVTVTGTVTTDGRVRDAHSLDLESSTDSFAISVLGDSLTFSGATGTSDPMDGVDMALADGTTLVVTGAVAALGNIPAGGSAQGTVVLDVASTARSGQIAYVDVDLASTAGGAASAVVPLVIVGPSLEAWMFVVDDTTNPPVSGDGDGVAEVGETVRLTPTVLNRGRGQAESVDGAITAGSGIALVDAADAYGALAPLGQSSGTNGYVFTISDSTGTSVDLTLTDSVGRSWAKTIEFVGPAAPESLDFTSDETDILLTWMPSPEMDLAGYNVYRSATAGSGHVRQNFELVRGGSRYVDEGLGISSSFWFYVTAVDSSGNESPASAEIRAWTTVSQVGGWPRSANNNVFSALLMADGDSSGTKELYVGSKDFRMYAWNGDGTEVIGWPLATGGEVWSTPAAADIDEDGDLEIFWGSLDSRFYAVHHDGTPVYGSSPIMVDLFTSGATMRSATTIADVDRDSDLEIFFGTDIGGVYAFNHDGTGLIDSTGLFFTCPPGNANARVWGTIAVGDMDLDGIREIAFASWNDSVYVFTPEGNLKPGWPRGGTDNFQAGPALGDLDDDGDLELIIGNNDNKLYAWNSDGSPVLGTAVFATLPDDIRSVPALCQLDADPELEIVVTCFDGRIYAFNHDGSGFLNPGGLFVEVDPAFEISASPIVVDVDGDGDFEILVGSRDENFYAFHTDGSTVVGTPIPTNGPIYSTASAGDLDGDGDVDVAFASYDNTVNVLDFPGASTPAAYEWATYGGNNFRTSVYGEKGPYQTGVDPALPVLAFALAQNAPNPFLTGTTIRYVVPRDTRVSLKVFDVSGRLVRTLVEGSAKAGVSTVVWDGMDGRGKRLSSGVYFYRLDDGENVLTRKSLLLR